MSTIPINVTDYDWPRVTSVDGCFGYDQCRDWKLASGMAIGSDEVDATWRETSSKLKKLLD